MTGRLLSPERPYLSADGFVLQVDHRDPFQALMLLGMFDRGTVSAVRQSARPGSVTVDAGSHVGYLAMQAARAVGPSGAVHAFEHDPRLVPTLRRHAKLNEMPWLAVNEVSLSDRRDTLQLQMTEQLGWSTVEKNILKRPTTVEVEAIPFDDYAREHDVDPQRISLIKVDVEGSELHVLRGMRKTLEAGNPVLLVEVDPARMVASGQDHAELLDLLSDLGYAPHRIDLDGIAGPLDSEVTGLTDVAFLKAGSR